MKQYLSIKPDLHQQAERICIEQPDLFKNWQAVLKKAIDYGIIRINKESVQEHTRTMNYKRVDNERERRLRFALRSRTCPCGKDKCNKHCRDNNGQLCSEHPDFDAPPSIKK